MGVWEWRGRGKAISCLRVCFTLVPSEFFSVFFFFFFFFTSICLWVVEFVGIIFCT